MVCPHTTCKNGGRQNRHHLWWPACDYRTALEKAFRNHPDHVITICMCQHSLEHFKKPPKKPTITQMREFLQGRKP